MPYAQEDYLDLVETTLPHIDRTGWADIVVDLQRHVAMPQILKKDKVEFSSGDGHQFNVRVDSNGAARNVRLAEKDVPSTADLFKRGRVYWRNTETHWALEERIIAMNRAPAQFVNILKGAEVDAMTDLADLMEQNFWTTPTSSDDETKPLGVPHWIVQNASQGFNGGAPSGFTTVGNLSPTTYVNWKNWTDTYSEVSETDCIRNMRLACYKTDWRPPVAHPGSRKGNDWRFFTTYDVVARFEEILGSQNSDLGDRLDPKTDKSIFRRSHIEPVPYLDQNTSNNPIYGINFRHFKIAFLSGEYMNKGKPMPHPLMHRTIVRYTDCTYAFFCDNRRTQFVLYQA